MLEKLQDRQYFAKSLVLVEIYRVEPYNPGKKLVLKKREKLSYSELKKLVESGKLPKKVQRLTNLTWSQFFDLVRRIKDSDVFGKVVLEMQ